MDRLPDLSSLSHNEKDALIHALWAQVQALTSRVEQLEAKLRLPPKTPDNSSLPTRREPRDTSSVPATGGGSRTRNDKPARSGPGQGSLGRKGGGRRLCEV